MTLTDVRSVTQRPKRWIASATMRCAALRTATDRAHMRGTTRSTAHGTRCLRQQASALCPMTPTSVPTPSCPTVRRDPTFSYATGILEARTSSWTSSPAYPAKRTLWQRQQPRPEQQPRRAMPRNTTPGMPIVSLRVTSLYLSPWRPVAESAKEANPS